ncbi:ABC transporter substrate-binding protein [Candidatus Acetatifactor stercoripullorum]|uniref:ABC transporter substrate-binding protein n=1 Tax=Candidatus Acetatifactor stercoripullorum TaxID=2838414 RepID=UPI00298DF03A|nr:ABC transporter substrate-binding protein [Candidatus Acetatifactor stercoripullorum]
MKKKLLAIVLAVTMLAGVTAGCGSADNGEDTQASGTTSDETAGAGGEAGETVQEGEPVYGGTLRFATPNSCASPGYTPTATDNSSLLYLNTAYESLTYFDEEGNIIPRLATEWVVDAEEPSITWTLREGVTFADGMEFNAEAVAVNIAEYQEAARTETSNIKSCEIIDDTHIKMVLNEMNSSSVESIGFFVYYMSPAALEDPSVLESSTCGTGAFQLTEFENNVFYRYEKNENYWQEGKPYLDAVEITIVAEPTTMATAFKASEYDMMLIQNNPTLITELNALSGVVAERNTSGQGLVATGLIPNSADPDSPWADERVRRALCYALDVDLLVEAFMFNTTETTDQWAAKGSLLYNDDINHYTYDPDRARELLAEAGYPDGFDTKLYCTTSSKDILTSAANMLGEVGINCEIIQVDVATQTELYSTGTWEGLMLHFASISPDLGLYMGRHLDEDGAFYAKGIQHPQEAMDLLAQIRGETDVETKIALSKDMQELIYDAENGLALFGRPLYIGGSVYFKYDYVKDDKAAMAFVSAWNVWDCWLDQ